MGIFDVFFGAKKNTASVARERLEILIKQSRIERDAPDYLPLMQRELLEVIRKYIAVDADAVKVEWHKEGDLDFLGISVTLPDKGKPAKPDDRDKPAN